MWVPRITWPRRRQSSRSRHAQLEDGQKRRSKSDRFAAHLAPHRCRHPSSIIVRAPRRSAAFRRIFLAQPPSVSIDLAAPCRQPPDRRTRQTASPAALRRYPLHPPPPPQVRLRHLQRSTTRPALNHFAPQQLDHSRTTLHLTTIDTTHQNQIIRDTAFGGTPPFAPIMAFPRFRLEFGAPETQDN